MEHGSRELDLTRVLREGRKDRQAVAQTHRKARIG